MTSHVWRRFAALMVCLVVFASCGASDDSSSEDATGDVAANDDAGDTDTNMFAADDPDAEATSIPVPENDAGAAEAIAGLDGEPTPEALTADRSTTARDFVRRRFNIDPDSEWVGCMVAETQRDDALDIALQTPSVAQGEVDDTEMRALANAMNGCIETTSLAEWTTLAIGPQGDVAETAPPCFAERFDDPDTGDITFSNFVALTYQYRLDPAGIEPLVDALATCAPITSLVGFFADQAEFEADYAVTVDRDCLTEAVSSFDSSYQFWSVFADGMMLPAEVIRPLADECSTPLFADLLEEIPADFEPWSGTGALADVVPAARNGAYDSPPPMTIDPAKSYEAVIATGGAEIRIRLFAQSAPVTVNNFVSLARDGYYDGTVFHRVLDDFMAQAGDPTGSGTGGPGYSFEDEFAGGETFDRGGLLAMANSGANTNGSQFFITFVPTEHLNGAHTIFGEVIEGMDVVDSIERRNPEAPAGRGQIVDSIEIFET